MPKKDENVDKPAREMTEHEKAVGVHTPPPEPTAGERALEEQVRALQAQVVDLEGRDRENALKDKVKSLQALVHAKTDRLAKFKDVPAGVPVRVRATRMGYYDHERRREGDVFTCADKDALGEWMEVVPKDTPGRSTTGKDDLRKKHDEAVALASPPTLVTGDQDVMATGTP